MPLPAHRVYQYFFKTGRKYGFSTKLGKSCPNGQTTPQNFSLEALGLFWIPLQEFPYFRLIF
jgi:hypothetical protein